MPQWLSRLAACAALLGMTASTTGCSAVGYWLGGAVDKSKPDTRPVRTNKIEKIDRGTVIDVYLLNGDHLTGDFSLVDKDPDDNSIEGIEFFSVLSGAAGVKNASPLTSSTASKPRTKRTRASTSQPLVRSSTSPSSASF